MLPVDADLSPRLCWRGERRGERERENKLCRDFVHRALTSTSCPDGTKLDEEARDGLIGVQPLMYGFSSHLNLNLVQSQQG